MAYWRMKLRAGSHGPDMWGSCKKESVAAITYSGIAKVDLSRYSRENRPPGWDQIRGAAAKGSLSHFAWDIRGGEVIYVADSIGKEIVGMGFAKAATGTLGYRFDAKSPILDMDGDRWCHLIDVDWDQTFVPFRYESPRAALLTVLELKQEEIELFECSTQEKGHRQSGLTEKEARETLLLETAYPRYTPAALRMIRREHVALSNQFTKWLKNEKGIRAAQEQNYLDAIFKADGKRFMVEFKVAHLGNSKRAIREALGQILEYNHYPPKVGHDHWLLILDRKPCKEDVAFMRFLRTRFGFPLTLGWRSDSVFDFEPVLNF